MAGELHDNAEARSITPNGAESSRLVVSNAEMATFQGATSKPGTTAVADREQAFFDQAGQGFTFAQFENVYGRNDVLAGDPLKDLQDGLNWLGKDSTREAAAEKLGSFPHRGQEDKFIDYASTKDAHNQFHLNRYGLPDSTIASFMRNEQHYFKPSDDAQDKEVRESGTVHYSVIDGGMKAGQENVSASIGPAQIQIRNIRDLVNATNSDGSPIYPQLAHMNDDPIRAALEQKNAALLVGAYLDREAGKLKQRGLPVTTESLAYAYNQDVFTRTKDGKTEYISPDLLGRKTLGPEWKPVRMSDLNENNLSQVLSASRHVGHIKQQQGWIEAHRPEFKH